MAILFNYKCVREEIPMSNLKDLETLEPLSLEEMEQVVGGGGCRRGFVSKKPVAVIAFNNDSLQLRDPEQDLIEGG